MTTVVVGAGLAGLFAGRRLTAAGEDVMVLEATPHLGGRTRGDREALRFGAVADLGASFLDRGQDFLLRFCLEHGIKLSAELALYPKGPGERYSGASILLGNLVEDGRRVSDEDRERLAKEVGEALAAMPPGTAETVTAWGRRAGLSPAAFARYTMQTGFNPVQRPAVTSSWHVHPGDIGRLCWLLDGSTDVIAQQASEGLDIRYEQPVRLISRIGSSYRVATENDEFVADEVVITASVHAIRRIGFDPVLPDWKTAALLQSPMTQGGKIVGQYRDGQRIWDAAGPSVLTDSGAAMFWLRRTAEDTVTVLGTMPDTGDGLLDDQDRALAVLDRQIRAMTGFEPVRIGGIVQNWTREEFFGGVVSSQSGGAARRQVIAAPVGGLHFAGEATGARWATAMEGAARSGERAADEILLKHRARQGQLA
ncbi:flavin monoamine oxidase family protein [Amycolatopsis nivea]